MSIQVANVSLASAVVGTTGKLVTFGNLLPPPTLAQQMRPQDSAESQAHLMVFNETGCLLTITLPESKQSKTLPAGRWWQFPIPPHETEVDYVVLAVASNPLFSSLLADFYGPGEPVDEMGTLGNSPIGGGVPLAVSQVINDNNPVVTTVAESTPAGGSQTVLLNNNGHFALTPNNPNTGIDQCIQVTEQNNPVTQAQDAVGILQRVSGDATSRFSERIEHVGGFGQVTLSDGTVAHSFNMTGTAAGVSLSGALAVTAGFSSDGANITTDGAGNISKVGGIATSGKRGVAIEAGRGDDVHVTSTVQTTIASFTVPNESPNPRVRCSAVFLIPASNTNAGVITLLATVTDPFSGVSSSTPFLLYTNTTPLLSAATVVQAGSQRNTIDIFIECKPNTGVQITYQNTAAGTIGDFVTALIELL